MSVGSILDRETTALYSLQIVADDGQRNGQFLPTVTVQIVVLDVNDNAPVFVSTLTSFSVQEDVTSGYQVCTTETFLSNLYYEREIKLSKGICIHWLLGTYANT